MPKNLHQHKHVSQVIQAAAATDTGTPGPNVDEPSQTTTVISPPAVPAVPSHRATSESSDENDDHYEDDEPSLCPTINLRKVALP